MMVQTLQSGRNASLSSLFASLLPQRCDERESLHRPGYVIAVTALRFSASLVPAVLYQRMAHQVRQEATRS